MTVGKDLILTEDKKEAIEKLRRNMGDNLLHLKKYKESTLLYRFLKARDWDVNQAEEMLLKTIEWRKKNCMDTLGLDYKPSEFLKEYFKNLFLGHGKDNNSLVYFSPLGKYDVNGYFKSAKVFDIERFLIQLVEDAETFIEKNFKELNSGFIYIFDVKDLTFAAATNKKVIELCSRFFKSQQDNYPERLKAIYVINASPLFTLPFSIIKNFLAASVLSKIEIYGKEGWQGDLLKVMDADQLPAFLGGEKTDPDGNPSCRTIVQQAGKIDPKYYIDKSTKAPLANSPGVNRIVISRASFLEKPLHIKDPGSLIEWEFETKTRDIGFGLFYKETDGSDEEKIVELVPLQRLNTEEFSETGMYKCDKSGNYVVLFDNSYSWVRSKEIFYRITIVNPKEHESRIHC